jgi:sphingolipid delta-4 desaturase
MSSSTLFPVTKRQASIPRHIPSDSSPSVSSYSPSESSGAEAFDSADEKEKPFDDPFPDFLWMTTEEPHRSRRMAILKAHPEASIAHILLLQC